MSCLISIFELSQSPAVWLTAPSVTHYHHLSHSRLSCTLSFLYPPTLSSLCCYSQHSRWGGMTWSVRCGRTESRCRLPSWGTRPSPGWTAGLGNHGAQNPPSWKKEWQSKNIRAKMVISTVWNQSEHKSDKWHQTGWEGLLVSLMSADASCRKLWVSYFGFFFSVVLHTRKIKNRILKLIFTTNGPAIISGWCNFPTMSYQPLTRLNVEQECVNTY